MRDSSLDYVDDNALTAFYVRNLYVIHNEFRYLPGTAISIGMGWGTPSYASNNIVSSNKIVNSSMLLQDSAAIYTLSPQPGSRIEANHILNAGLGKACLYPDDGTTETVWTRNVCEGAQRWLHLWRDTIHSNTISGNFSTTENLTMEGPDNTIENNQVISDGQWLLPAQAVIQQWGVSNPRTYVD